MNKLWSVRPITLNNQFKPMYDSKTDFFFSDEIVSVGLPFTGDLTNTRKQSIHGVVRQQYNGVSDTLIGQYSKSLERFIFEIKIGDLILLSHIADQFSVAKITGDYQYISESDEPAGYPHIRQVKWLKEGMARTILSMSLRKGLGKPSPVVDISGHYTEIQTLVDHGTPVAAENQTVNVAYPLRPDYTVNFKVPADMTKQEAERFSDFIKTIFYR